MAYAAGQKVRASDLNALLPSYARYERNSGLQGAATGANTQVQFPTIIDSDPDVTPSGASNNAFTLAAPANWDVVWEVTVSVCLSVGTATAELSIATGSTTWAVGNVKAANGSPNRRVETSVFVPVAAGTTVAVTVNLFQSSGGSINIEASNFPTQISFKR